VCRGNTHCALVGGSVPDTGSLDTGYAPLIQAVCPRNRQYVLNTLHRQCVISMQCRRYRLCILGTGSVFEIQAVRTIHRQCVLVTSIVFCIQAVCPVYKQCVLYTSSVSWIQAVCPRYRQCVNLDTGRVSWIQAVCPGYKQCVQDTGSVSWIQAVCLG
jgi:hypothetical protein